jgi:hypothetical protein
MSARCGRGREDMVQRLRRPPFRLVLPDKAFDFANPMLGLRNAEIPTDFPCERFRDFRVPRQRGTPVICRITPPRMPPPLADQHAPLLPKVSNQLVPFHAERFTSS